MSFELSAQPEELRKAFFALTTPQDLADLLEIPYRDLIYYIYRTPEDSKYQIFEIPKKSGGTRQISSPNPSLKILQQKLKQILTTVYEPNIATNGFVTGKSIVSNATIHRNQRYVLNVDLKDFFPSINFGRVRGIFLSAPYNLPPEVATVFANICNYKNGLPQGAPTSPIISNMICSKLDRKLNQLARKYKCYYTRYADDITFSTSIRTFPPEIGYFEDEIFHLGEEVNEIISSNGFVINLDKLRLQTRDIRQEVTGLIVNERVNVPRKFDRQIRAMLHDWEVNGIEAAQQKHLTFRNNHRNPQIEGEINFRKIVRGKIAFLGMVRGDKDKTYSKYKKKYDTLIARDQKETYKLNKSFQVFISYSHDDKVFAKRLYTSLRDLVGVWIDDEGIPVGENWSNRIDRALRFCNVMLLLMSPSSMKSPHVEDEWQAFHRNGKRIIPILIKPLREEEHYQLANLQKISFNTGSYERSMAQLKEALFPKSEGENNS